MAIARSGDARIYYEVHGAGPAVLLVHGSGGHHAAWWQQVAALSPDYTVITVDLRGFGNSRWDADMLAIAHHGFAVNPNPDLEKRARESGWTIYWPVLKNQIDRKEDIDKGH